jgi:hypothetical protein
MVARGEIDPPPTTNDIMHSCNNASTASSTATATAIDSVDTVPDPDVVMVDDNQDGDYDGVERAAI